MEYHEFAPPPKLAPFIRCFWTLRSLSSAPQRIVPDGAFELVLHFGNPFVRDGYAQPAAMLVGEIRRPVIVSPAGPADVLGLRFKPGGAASFLPGPARAFADVILPLREVFGPAFEDQILESESTAGRLAILAGMLSKRYDERRGAPVALAACSLIESRGGRIRIREIAAALGSTERTLERAFAAVIGMSAKSFSRLTRFQSALTGGPDSYFDDSHRIRDFHEFSGTTPCRLRRERNPLNDAFVGNIQDSAARLS